MLLAGAAVNRLPGQKYFSKLPFAEFGPRAPLPRIPTLRRLRSELPESFVVALRAPQSSIVSARGPMRFDEGLERAFAWLLEARDALAAKLVVLSTPAELSPSARDRTLLKEFVARLPRDVGCHYVWEPHGPWEPQDASKLAQELGLVLSFDPLLAHLPPGPVAYARLQALGERKTFSDATLEDVAAQLLHAAVDERFVVIDAPRGFDFAVRLQKLSGESEPDDA